MQESVPLWLIVTSIAAILLVTAVGILLVNKKANTLALKRNDDTK